MKIVSNFASLLKCGVNQKNRDYIVEFLHKIVVFAHKNGRKECFLAFLLEKTPELWQKNQRMVKPCFTNSDLLLVR